MLRIDNNSPEYFLSAYRQSAGSISFGAGDAGDVRFREGAGRRIKEEFVRCIWFEQHVKKEKLYTDGGARLEVVAPGWWNSGGGPDFQHAEILLEGRGLVKGSVEIHVFASDWIRHGHHRQKTYDTVCLHVVMWNDIREEYVKNCRDRDIPQLTLSKFLSSALDDIIDLIDTESCLRGGKVLPGYCQTEREKFKVDEQWIGRFLDCAGDERIVQKAQRYEKWVDVKPFEQTLYEAIMESLGYKNNKEPFRMLAMRMPQEDLRSLIPEDIPVQEKNISIQSLLLGMAGLLPGGKDSGKMYDAETEAFLAVIKDKWNTFQPKVSREPMTRENWNYAGLRPANFPERRVVAISTLLSECLSHGIFNRVLYAFQRAGDSVPDAASFDRLTATVQSLFLDVCDPYWSYRYTWGGKKLRNSQKLLGAERVSGIIINVIVPVFLVYADKHHDMGLKRMLSLLYRNYGPLPATSVTRFMVRRVLGQSKLSGKIVNSARRQQGLYKIFKDFCENEAMSCNECVLYLSFGKAGT
ncbi:MAG: DUF2851 family protein [Candidatus Brocadiaceae bacterium]|nr:DUF2851 family protein [Candidatus Brocadiaceae bacterium]